MSGPRYETAYELLQRLGHTDSVVCTDCGVFVMDKAAHTRFHSILSAHAWTLAVLKTSHIAPHVHDKYDAVERIDSRKFDSWSADALAEVVTMASRGAGSAQETTEATGTDQELPGGTERLTSGHTPAEDVLEERWRDAQA